MPSCQNLWELCNLVFPGLWSLLKQNLCLRGEKLPGKRMLKRVFWSFGSCINGFAYCKPIIQVDEYMALLELYWHIIDSYNPRQSKPYLPSCLRHCRRGDNFSMGIFSKELEKAYFKQAPLYHKCLQKLNQLMGLGHIPFLLPALGLFARISPGCRQCIFTVYA